MRALEVVRGPLIVAVLLLVAMIAAFRDGLGFMVAQWASDEYSYAYLVPPIAAWLVWRKRHVLAAIQPRGAWSGLIVVAFGLLLGVFGEISTIYTVIHYAFIVTIWGVAITWFGWRGARVIAAPLAYLLFMVPLPNFLYQGLSTKLQLLSSSLGVEFIRMFGISVFLQGNVIDLGVYQLQVVEACSGLRYLFPLMSFGFLCACLFKGPLWARVILFLATIPITVIINSVRIGVTGLLVNSMGIAVAEGFLHDFEGWIIFLVAVGVLFALMWLLSRAAGRRASLRDILDLDGGAAPAADAAAGRWLPRPGAPILTALAIVTLAAASAAAMPARTEAIPTRPSFTSFPLHLGTWRGHESALDQMYVDALKFDDYVLADYVRAGDRAPVNFYVAYYGSQRKGASVHSPRSCLPGGGWEMTEFGQSRITGVTDGGDPLVVNRTIIANGNSRQLVYYWFQQRGRELTNEYHVKWMIFWDALTRNRTDGALVRLVTPVQPGEDVAAADRRLSDFLDAVYPSVQAYVPG